MQHLQGRTVIVTGGSSGIGSAVVSAFIEEGADVWTVSRRTIRPREHLTSVRGDLSLPSTRAALARSLGGTTVDVVIHAAAVLGPPDTPLATYPRKEWYRVMEVNLHAVHFLHRRLLPHFSPQPTVIGVSSGVGRHGRAGWGMYAISKFALEGWLEVLADEWRDEGRVYSVNPGATATPMRAAAMPHEDPASLPTPADITPLFLRLAHPSCAVPTGQRLDARDWIGKNPWAGLHTV